MHPKPVHLNSKPARLALNCHTELEKHCVGLDNARFLAKV